VAIDTPSHDVLVAFEDGAESVRPLVKAVCVARGVMCHENGNFSSLFEAVQSLVEPGKDITRVVSLSKKVEVHVVAGLSVDCNDVHTINVLQSSVCVLCSQTLAIITVFGIDCLCLFIKISVPKLKIICNHRVLLGEILGVGLDEIVVTF
jgi:hypothetical protein